MIDYYTVQKADNRGADQTSQMRLLVWGFVVLVHLGQVFPNFGVSDHVSLKSVCSTMNTC